jgi:hypothetical protein
MKYFPNVLVTPEISFNKLVKYVLKTKKLPSDMDLNLFKKLTDLKNLELQDKQIKELLKISKTWSELLKNILNLYGQTHYSKADWDVYIIKHTNTGFFLNWIDFPKILRNKFIFLLRDPRAVINSKLKTPRPYYPCETMAWYGVYLAAYRWKAFVEAAEKIAQNDNNLIYFVKYEDFISDFEKTLKQFSEFLNVPITPQQVEYKIPDAEKYIHSLVLKGEIETSRLEAWKKELEPKFIKIIESVLWKKLIKYNYIPIYNLNKPQQFLYHLYGFLDSSLKVLKHFWNVKILKCK